MKILKINYLGNTIEDWIIAFLIFVTIAIIILGIKRYFFARTDVKDTINHFNFLTFIVPAIENTFSFFILGISIYFGSKFVNLGIKADNYLEKIIIIIVFIQIAVWVNTLINFYLNNYKNKKTSEDPASATSLNILFIIVKAVVFGLIILLFLDQVGFNITTLVAGLGVGGIAVALAVQNILGDLFSSLTIVLDKPFEVGDFLIVNDFLGTVEKIGLKTTRLRSLSGEQLVFSNTDLLQSRIRNYKRMKERRVLFNFGVIYNTPLEKLKKIPSIIKSIFDSIDNARFDRAHFMKYGNFSLDFEVVYYVLVADYNAYADIQQKINLEIFKMFKEEQIDFAYPTQTLFINKD